MIRFTVFSIFISEPAIYGFIHRIGECYLDGDLELFVDFFVSIIQSHFILKPYFLLIH